MSSTRRPTISVRSTEPTIATGKMPSGDGIYRDADWLQKDGSWGRFETRFRFCNETVANARVVELFGEDFQRYGTFPNS